MDNLNELLKNYESKTAKIDKNYFYVDKEQVIKEINKQRAKPLARSLEFLEKYKHKKGYESEKQFYTRLYKAKSFNAIKEGDPLLARLAHHTKQGDFFAMLQITKYQDKESQTNAIKNVKYLQSKKIKFYKTHLNRWNKGKDFKKIFEKENFILNGVNFGSYRNIEQNIYYALDGTDFVLKYTLKEPQKAQIGSFTARFFNNFDLKKEITAQRINPKPILKKYNAYTKQIQSKNTKANTALLYSLFYEKNEQGGYKYRKFIISIIQDYLYSNQILESYFNSQKIVSDNISKAKSQQITEPKSLEKFLKCWIYYRYLLEK